MGLALFNYESSNGAFPPACKSINLTTSPPSVQFPDTGFSVQARILSYIEGGYAVQLRSTFLTSTTTPAAAISRGRRAAISIYRLPVEQSIGRTRDTAPADPNASPYEQTAGHRLRVHGLRPVGLHRHQRGERHRWPPAASVPPRSSPTATRLLAAKGLLKDGKTAISRDHRRDQQYDRDHRVRAAATSGSSASIFESQYPVVRGQGPAGYANGRGTGSGGGPTRAVRSGRRASPTTRACRRTRGCPGRPHRRRREIRPGPTRSLIRSTPAASTHSSATARSASSRDTVNLVAFRSILTLAGGETVSSDQY